MVDKKEIMIAGISVTLAAYFLTRDVKTVLAIAAVHGGAHYLVHQLHKPQEDDCPCIDSSLQYSNKPFDFVIRYDRNMPI